MSSTEDYKAMHTDGLSLGEISNRMTRFAGGKLAEAAESGQDVEADEEEDDEKSMRKKMLVIKLKKLKDK